MDVSVLFSMNFKRIQYLGTILLGAASTPDNDRLICQNNNSLFQLIGNPGMIWHPLSGQCVSTIEIDSNVSGIDTDTNDSGKTYSF
jgi:hypothetical protein